MKYLVLSLTLLAGIVAAASEAGHGGGHGLDQQQIKTILYQTFNFTVLVIGMIYYLKDPVKAHFKEKKSSYVAASQKANNAKNQAEKEQMDIQVRLNRLESTADESISRARAEAADMKNQLIAEAQVVSKKIREEAESAARIEIEKAKIQLREQLLADSILMARNQMQNKVSAEDHKRLQGEFINNIQVVQP